MIEITDAVTRAEEFADWALGVRPDWHKAYRPDDEESVLELRPRLVLYLMMARADGFREAGLTAASDSLSRQAKEFRYQAIAKARHDARAREMASMMANQMDREAE